jgi:cobalamin biosynthesis protein CobD/CbiB
MSLLALLACLLAQHAFPPRAPQPLMAFYGRMALSVAKRLDAGDRNSGILAWAALMGLVLVPAILVMALASAIHPVALWLLEIGVLFATLRFLATLGHAGAIERALREGDFAAAASRLAQWRAEPVTVSDASGIARLATEQSLREAHQGTFGPLFWYLVLPGPLGLVLYPLALRAARAWEHVADPTHRDFGWFAARAFHVIDWIPQRLTAFAFAAAGNFEDALYCWRTQAAQWPRPEEGIVLASGAGALGVRLGEPAVPVDEANPAPVAGTGDWPGEDTLASLEGLLWRSLAVWMVAFLLAAALQAR